MRVLLLSAYDASSHQYWHKGLVARLAGIEWTVLTLPPRYFSWRIRGNPLSWFAQQKTLLNQSYHLLIATSMVDVATLKGLIPKLATLPTLVYFHENQFAYPENHRQKTSVEAQMVSVYSGLAADIVAFNSAYNRDSYLKGIGELLSKLPDHAPLSVVDDIEKKCQVLPVPIENNYFVDHKSNLDQALTLVWNHRWEYDKAPERLYAALKILAQKRIDFRLHLIGEQFRTIPPVFEQMQQNFSSQIINYGYIEDNSQYQQILTTADVVISTAIHEFQGLSILKAVASGCIPVVPDRLSYQELFPEKYRYQCHHDPDKEAIELAKRLELLVELKKRKNFLVPPDVSHLAWSALLPRYQQLISQFAS